MRAYYVLDPECARTRRAILPEKRVKSIYLIIGADMQGKDEYTFDN